MMTQTGKAFARLGERLFFEEKCFQAFYYIWNSYIV
jgi:hypothetical protein